MRRWNGSGLTRAFSEESDEARADAAAAVSAANGVGETTEADYAFEGYSVEFLDKVALLPVSTAASAREAGR